MRHLMLLVVLLMLCLCSYGQNHKGKDYALFFANKDYTANSAFNNLKNPIKDARAIAKELEDMYDFDEATVYENYGRKQIYRILERWQQRKFGHNDQFFLFFSGHGAFWEFTKKGYFVPRTTENDYSAYIELTDLANIITQIPCRHILLAVDACYSGTIDQEIAFKGRGFSRPKETAVSERDNLIARQLRNQSRLLLTSGGKQRTPDGNDHSPFAKAILDGLRAAYTYGDGLFTFTDLMGKLERVSPTPHQGELPRHEQGGFVFVAEDSSDPPPPDNMVYVRGGSFQMGSNNGEGDEKPVHSVTLSDYYIGRFEVTFDDYDAFCTATNRELPNDRGWGRGKRPVIYVSWLDAVAYCNWLSEQHRYQPVYTIKGEQVQANWNANGYRLPTEAEWEYAARSRGGNEKWAGTSSENDLTTYANGSGDKDGYSYTAPVGSFRANDLGLHDMSGNVYEWCWDWKDTYPSTAQNNPKGLGKGSVRVLRGGSWFYRPARLRCAYRNRGSPGSSYSDMGFRLSRAGR